MNTHVYLSFDHVINIDTLPLMKVHITCSFHIFHEGTQLLAVGGQVLDFGHISTCTVTVISMSNNTNPNARNFLLKAFHCLRHFSTNLNGLKMLC